MLPLSAGLHADVYKCVIDGVSTYSDSPCGRQATKMDLPDDSPVQQESWVDSGKNIVKILWQFLSDSWYLVLIFIVISIALLKTPKAR